MQVNYRAAFDQDVAQLPTPAVARAVARAIENVKAARGPHEIRRLKKIAGAPSYYRIRVGDYRIGLSVEADQVTFLRCLPRRDIYRKFPPR